MHLVYTKIENQLADLAYDTAINHNILTGEIPKVAFLSFSTNSSSEHYRVSKVQGAVNIFHNYSCPFELMHTVSTYPMKTEHANLNLINTLKKEFNCKVGYSGHESGLSISLAASTLGISSLERHITLDRSMYGSDQAASLEPTGLRQLVGGIRKIQTAMGDGKKKIIEDEKKIAKKLRQHIIN